MPNLFLQCGLEQVTQPLCPQFPHLQNGNTRSLPHRVTERLNIDKATGGSTVLAITWRKGADCTLLSQLPYQDPALLERKRLPELPSGPKAPEELS